MGNQDPVPYVDIVNGNAPLPTDPSITRIARSGDGTLQASVGGSPYGPLGSSVANDWFSTEAAAHFADVPALTTAVPVQLGIANSAGAIGAAAQDAAVEGGALKGTGSAWAMLQRSTVYQNLKTSKWGFSFKAAMPTITSLQSGYVGITNTGGTQQVVIGTDNARSTTDFVAFGYNGSPTTLVHLGTADNQVHTWRVTSNGTTVKFYKDGVQQGTLTISGEANFPTAAGAPGFYCSASAVGQAVYACVYSFVGP